MKNDRQNDEEIYKLRRSTQELRKEFGTSKRSRAGAILQEASQDTQLSRIEVLRDNLEFQKDSAPQPQGNQKEEGLFSLLKCFVKKILEKLLGEDEKSVDNARGIKEDAQRDTSNNKEQHKSKHFDKILNQDQSVSEGLMQATKLENPTKHLLILLN